MAGFRTETYYDEDGYFVTKKCNDELSSKNNTTTKGAHFIKQTEFKMWIIDILNINKNASELNQSQYYNFCGYSVKIVDVYGVVTEVCPNRFGVLYKVDDGTGEINCWQDNRNIIKKADIKDKVNSIMAGIYESNSANDSLNTTTFSIAEQEIENSRNTSKLEVAQWLETQILKYTENENDYFAIGDTVHLRGNVADFRGERCILVYNIQPSSVTEEIDRRFELIHLYEKVYYPKQK